MTLSVATSKQSRKAPAKKASSKSEEAVVDRPAWYNSTLALALSSGVLWWATFPPLNLWPLAWIAPVGLLILIGRKKLSGRRPYATIWLAGFVHWMLMVQFFRLPHWTGYIGWVAASWYLAFYFPAFVALSRVAVHRLRMPLMLAAPIVLVGLELVRGHVLGGFSLALLGHSQVAWTTMIQIADLCGAYGVSFLMVLVAAGVARMLPCDGRRWQWWPVLPILLLPAVALGYGFWRTGQSLPGESDRSVLKAALIQGNYLTIFDSTSSVDRSKKSFAKYMEDSLKASKQHPDLDVVIWPESMFSTFQYRDEVRSHVFVQEMIHTPDATPKPEMNMDQDEFLLRLDYQERCFREHTEERLRRLNGTSSKPSNISMLVGCDTTLFKDRDYSRYNSALLIDPSGQVVDRYYKMNRVIFGEYVPFGKMFPWLYKLTPMGEGLTAGQRPRAFRVNGYNLGPNVCFESTVPHLIRRNTARLRKNGSPVDVLVNLTNDGWFKGSSCLDLHLACNVFRSVENRRPTLVAANGGMTAWVDGNGRVRQQLPRQTDNYLIAEVQRDGRDSLYQHLGDGPVVLCTVFCGVLAVMGCVGRFRPAQPSKPT